MPPGHRPGYDPFGAVTVGTYAPSGTYRCVRFATNFWDSTLPGSWRREIEGMPAHSLSLVREDATPMPVVPAGPRYQSWGRYPRVARQDVLQIVWRCDVPRWDTLDRSVLPFGQGRSYGDSCLNEGGVLLDASGLRRFISFDHDHGILACEAGVTLAEILAVTLPRGWILPVIPGTKFVSVGGAIANDIHGKNHHRAGSFGCHVRNLELLRSSGERMTCSPESHSDLFAATVGGLGLTGLILSAELQLARVGTALLEVERIRFGQLNEFFEISEESDATCEHTVAWIDCLAGGRKLGRGVFHRANHVQQTVPAGVRTRGTVALSVPFYAPRVLLNRYTMKAFNTCYYGGQFTTTRKRLTPYERFFFPLDSVRNWNRVYGRPGFLQYQCVVPPRVGRDAIREILERTARAGRGSFLAVLKQFGQRASPGLLSFPRPGLTLALDFPFQGRPTLALCDDLDAVVAQAGGAVYPAKDARMSPEHFARYYPTCDDFLKHMDPRFSSSFWRRVTGATD